jgi:hypothetical protein
LKKHTATGEELGKMLGGFIKYLLAVTGKTEAATKNPIRDS